MKTSEEIKKGLECCQHNEYNGLCECDKGFPYRFKRCDQLRKDALAYIEELESRLAQVEMERDAAVHDLKLADRVDCDFCKHQYGECTYDGCQNCSKPCPCGSCRNSSNYEWRGVCEANTEEETK